MIDAILVLLIYAGFFAAIGLPIYLLHLFLFKTRLGIALLYYLDRRTDILRVFR